MVPVVAMSVVADRQEAFRRCRSALDEGGRGHTAAIHTGDTTVVEQFARAMPASRVLVNTPASLGCVGLGNGLSASFSLGCGTAGGTSTTNNVTYRDLVNVQRIALPDGAGRASSAHSVGGGGR